MQTGDHWQEDLAKFDCRPNMKVKKIEGSFYILATCWSLLLKSDNLYKFQNIVN
jgi:hypothetical protein